VVSVLYISGANNKYCTDYSNTVYPRAMKAFIGVASELFPIRGYNKKYLALFAILIGLAGSSALLGTSILLPLDEDRGQDLQHFADWLVVCFTAISYEAASLDILAEGKVRSEMSSDLGKCSVHHLALTNNCVNFTSMPS
jgi:hypothetical protein